MESFSIPANMSGSQTDCISERKSKFWHIEKQPIVHRSEVICPKPHRVTRTPCLLDNLNRVSSSPKSILSISRVETGYDILDYYLTKDGPEDDMDLNNQSSFFCGSPPLRTDNPMIHDPQFVKKAGEMPSHLAISPDIHKRARVEKGSPTCGSSFGGSPKMRIEGFSCGSPESHCVVPALGVM